MDPNVEDANGENCFTLAIKNRRRDLAIWLVQSQHFRLHECIRPHGFNYFAYALIKGQQVVANEILQILKCQNLAADDVLNQRIDTASYNGQEVTLFDLFLRRRYRSGLNFLLYVCHIKNIPDWKHNQAISIVNVASPFWHFTNNGTPMADKSST